MSPITSTAALRASPTVQCGAGWVSGTPGDSTSAAIFDQSMCRRSAVTIPAALACAILAPSSSPATTSARPASNACALARPEAPSPNSATLLPANVPTRIVYSIRVQSIVTMVSVTGTTSSPQFQRGQAGEREHDRDDPEADHDLRLGPPELLEMMVDRRHLEDAPAGKLERDHLHDHRD